MLGRQIAVLAGLLVWAPHVYADPAPRSGDTDPNQLVLVNATTKLGDLGQISRLRRALDTRGMLLKLPEPIEATLDQRNVLVSDLEAIREAYANGDYQAALKIISTDESRILENASAGDPTPALAELSQWKGIIAGAMNQPDEALKWFRAAYRFNPAWQIDKKLASPRVRSLVKKAKIELEGRGQLRVDADPEGAMMAIDGSQPRPATDKVELPVGMHLVTISAPHRSTYAELVDLPEGQPYKIAISLDAETNVDRTARLVDETVSAPPGKDRLKRAKALSKATGANRLLVVEDGGEDHVTVRLYDVNLKKVSKTIDLAGAASSAAIARQIKAALDPENLMDVNTIVVAQRQDLAWYQHWYVWVGAAAVIGASIGGYEYMTREPTMVHGF